MKTTEIVSIDGRQAVKLPAEFSFSDTTVSIRREGAAIILEPIKSDTWPAGFFESIHIDDPSLVRPPQGAAGLVNFIVLPLLFCCANRLRSAEI